MDIARLASLALCGLLAVAATPWADAGDTRSPASPVPETTRARSESAASAAAHAANAEAGRSTAVDAADAEAGRSTAVDAAIAETAEPAEDAAIVAAILERLEIRHTALPERERIALARTILREARLHGLEPDLVLAVIEVESAGYHLAVSHVGAMGLMQLLPTTGEEVAARLGIDWMGPDTLFDPTTNVRLGTAYLKQLSDRYDGDVGIALAAYNWGPGRIDRRLRRGASVPSRYIEQVMRAYDRTGLPVSRRS